MKKAIAFSCLMLTFAGCSGRVARSDYPITPVPYKDVHIDDAFWKPRIEKTRTVTLPYLLDLGEKSGRFGDMRLIEAACYFLAQNPDPALKDRIESKLDRSIERIRGLKQKWPNAGDGSLGGAGGFFLGAVAYYQATGSRKLLDVAIEIADDIDSVFGPGKRHDISNHEGIKMGLISLYRATGDEKYIRLARFFLDERGNPGSGRALYGPYAQDHQPVVEQTRAIGHAVRATYLYGPLTDIAALTGESKYAQADERIWEDAVSKRTYLTGGVGSYRDDEDYGDDYDLPNLSCWNEICAAVGNTWWNHKMFLLNRDAKYLDVMERTLYNGLLTGVSLKGDTFLYQAPLKTYGSFARQPRFGPNCCPPNITRLLASMGNLIYAQEGRNIYVNLFVGSRAEVKTNQGSVNVAQETEYPWNGSSRITVRPQAASNFAVFVRIPGWARNEAMPGLLYRFLDKDDSGFGITVNGKPATYQMERGFARIEREWASGDAIEVKFPMPVRRLLADGQVADDRGMVALERGPLVFCAEQADNPGGVFRLVVPDSARMEFAFRKDLLDGIGAITGEAVALSRGADRVSVNRKTQPFTAIPYYAFGNRSTGEMAVWLARDESKAMLSPVPTVASTSRATSSSGNGTVAENYPGRKPPTIAQRLYPNAQDGSGDIRAIYDQVEPANSVDGSSTYLRLRPQEGDKAWVQYDFAAPAEVSSTEVYWKDDKQYCLAPAVWTLLYRDGNAWKPVHALGAFGVDKDRFNKVLFDPVKTSGLRIEIQLRGNTFRQGKLGPPDGNWMKTDLTWFEGGVIEWRVSSAGRP
jgi:uncharacterized protein